MEEADTVFKVEDRMLQPEEIKQLASLIIDEPDHYAALGIDRAATPEEINQSYCAAVNCFHPLKYQTIAEPDGVLQWTLGRAIRRVEQAYFILSSRSRRREYNVILDRRIQSQPAMPRQEESAIRKGNSEIWRALATSQPQPEMSAATNNAGANRSQESRRVTRVSIQAPVIVTLEHHWQEMAESRDISPLGIKLALSHPVEPGALLELELPMPVSLRTRDFDDDIYRVKAYVLYVTEERGKRMVACEFV